MRPESDSGYPGNRFMVHLGLLDGAAVDRSELCVRRTFALLAALTLVVVGVPGCTDNQIAQEFRSLERSGAIALVCRDMEGGEGRPLAACPDTADDGESRHLIALVTQTQRGEVALVDFSTGKVVDTDPSVPGPTFLPVGALPVDIVSTPGGIASFVGVAEPGREGIFGLPTTCLEVPGADQSVWDVTSWPACALPSAPEKLAIVVDRPDGESTESLACDGSRIPAPEDGACVADLSGEETFAPAGRRKLVATLPALGSLVVMDAQAIMNRAPGSFEPCEIEAWVELSTAWPDNAVVQPIPERWRDLAAFGFEANTDLPARCARSSTFEYPAPTEAFVALPAGMALAEDTLYVADRGAPIIHAVDVSDPCELKELPPLVAVSYSEPEASVFTRDVAVSPTTPSGARYLYAVDDTDGSLITYDIGEQSSSRAPLLRPHAPLMPREPADRLQFASPVRDLAIFARDVAIPDPESGVAILDTACAPEPSAEPPASLYRTSEDYSTGARPGKLRGVFVAAALANGDVAFVDIEDLDDACRRPVLANPSAVPNQYGCANDPDVGTFQDKSGLPTVSAELSCNIVSSNELRSGSFFISNGDVGVRAPSLRYFPRLINRDGLLASGAEDAERVRPLMLGVPFTTAAEEPPAELRVGSRVYSARPASDNPLILDPATAAVNSLLLPLDEPRAYATRETFAATYEGPLGRVSNTGRLNTSETWISDSNTDFCRAGTQDIETARTWAGELGLTGARADAFANRHADYVQLSAELDEDDPYWERGGRACVNDTGFRGCQRLFGTLDDPRSYRDLTVLEAHRDRLLLSPRAEYPDGVGALWEEVACCFPSPIAYVIRGGRQWVLRGSVDGFQHRVAEGESGRCELTCDPRRARSHGRVLEISADPACGSASGIRCPIGRATADDVACVVPAGSDGLEFEVESIPRGCFADRSTARFGIYRGGEPSERDMSFSWEVTGGFRPLRANIASTISGTSVLPQAIRHVEQSDRLVVVDGIAGGLSLLSLSTLRLSPTNPYY